MKVKIAFSSFALVLLTLLYGCADQTAASDQAGGRASSDTPLQVLCTFGLVTDVVEAVGGDLVDVTTLMGPGVDPHVYRPTPSDVTAMERANVIFYSGLGMEARMEDLFEKMSDSKHTFAITSEIPEELLRQPEEFEGQVDPHVWHDPMIWIYTVDSVESALIELLPDHAEVLRENAEEYRQMIRTLDAEIQETIGAIPGERRVLATAHDAFGYLAIRYGIDVLPVQGVTTEGEASIADIRQIAQELADRRVPAVFLEATVPPASMNALVEAVRSRGHEINFGGELFADTVGPAGSGAETYEGMMRANISTIADALQ